mmetsp:Transcript_1072/g.2426  ORF Transcript_1072/g.2426 Transcript_1072/m.2426 type:complete len:262 (-) Transcript_1072:2725-3510(-)
MVADTHHDAPAVDERTHFLLLAHLHHLFPQGQGRVNLSSGRRQLHQPIVLHEGAQHLAVGGLKLIVAWISLPHLPGKQTMVVVCAAEANGGPALAVLSEIPRTRDQFVRVLLGVGWQHIVGEKEIDGLKVEAEVLACKLHLLLVGEVNLFHQVQHVRVPLRHIASGDVQPVVILFAPTLRPHPRRQQLSECFVHLGVVQSLIVVRQVCLHDRAVRVRKLALLRRGLCSSVWYSHPLLAPRPETIVHTKALLKKVEKNAVRE